MQTQTNRRDFLRASTAVAAGVVGFPYVARAQNAGEKLKMAVIGAGGRGKAGMNAAMGEQLVAIADVDLTSRAGKAVAEAKDKFPGVKSYTDYRRLFDAHPDLDAVWVATPDHSHFPASIRALEAGAAVYCEKPLTHTIWEARKLRRVAAEKKLVTQMGNQGHSSETIRTLCEYIWAGTIGDVTKVHCVSNRRFSAKPPRPAGKKVPEGLDWEAWLGPAPYRDYHDGLHPFSWRGYVDFGTASLGDMGCHTMDGSVWALKLHQAPSVEVDCEVGHVNAEGFSPEARIVFRFPERAGMPPVTLTWWNGGKDHMPPRPEALEAERKQLTQGAYYYGDRGVMMSGSHCQGVRIIPEAQQKETPRPEKTIPRVPGHAGDFIRACKDPAAPAPSGNFDYAVALTEIVLLGTVALKAQRKVVYDFTTGTITNDPVLNELLRREPRQGWEFGYDV